jgi:hypothetical protein
MMPIMNKYVEKVEHHMQDEVLAALKESEKPKAPASGPTK